jgi:outer membrane protein OmpA-like peptidoglycan-associated protein
MRQNPSLKIGIDGSSPRGSDQNLGDRRVDAVRKALIKAGVMDSRIQTGAFGDEQLARERRVEVLISSANY